MWGLAGGMAATERRVAVLVLVGAGMTAPAYASGMPQLAFGNPLLTAQVVWGAIIFAVFYVGVSRYGLPRVDAILEHRAGVIGADLEQARLAKQNADQAVAELTAARNRAYAEGQAAVNAATQQAKDETARRAEEEEARMDRQVAASEAEITAARARAMASLREVASVTAEAVVTRLIHRPANAGSVRDAVGIAMRGRDLEAV